jgi:hypothetical protein
MSNMAKIVTTTVVMVMSANAMIMENIKCLSLNQENARDLPERRNPFSHRNITRREALQQGVPAPSGM